MLLSPGASAEGTVSDSIKRPVARLVVKFEGGILGDLMAEVIDKLTALPAKSIPVKPEILVAGNQYCPVLAQELAIPLDACTQKLVRSFIAFSERHGREPDDDETPGLSPIYLPDIKPQLGTFSRVFDTSKEEDRRRLQDVSKQPEWTKIFRYETIVDPSGGQPTVSTRGNATRSQDVTPRSLVPEVTPYAYNKTITPSKDGAIHRLTFESYRWAIPIRDPEVVDALTDLSYELTTPNRTVILNQPSTGQDRRTRKFALTPGAALNRCSVGEGPQTAPYTAYLPVSSYAKSAQRCTAATGQEPVQVFVLDTKVAPHPDLRKALRFVSVEEMPDACKLTPPDASGAAPARACARPGSYIARQHHGTYLSGIVASSGESSGLVGIAANAQLNSFVWDEDGEETGAAVIAAAVEEEDPATRMVNFLEACGGIDKPKVFLFASNFKNRAIRPEHLVSGRVDADYSRMSLRPDQAAKRWLIGPYNAVIRANQMIFIVAAGQREGQEGGDKLTRSTLLYPQSLGDLENVVVVSACEGNCQGDQVRVWRNANYSDKEEQVVHLMAPGGESIPSFITEDSVGGAPGTSASSAFVAGVAAKMMSCYPSHFYARASRVKERLMLTARPNLALADAGKVAAGTVDPELAMIDPTASWLRMDGQEELAEISPQHWCQERIGVRDPVEGVDASVETARVRRITRLDSGGYVIKQLSHDPGANSPHNTPRLVMNMDGPGELTNRAPILAVKLKGRTASCSLSAGRLRDVILAGNVGRVRACANLTPCDQQ